MIESIGIRGIGVIESAELPLGAGFTALTGETGAGKTMVVTALGLLLGYRSGHVAGLVLFWLGAVNGVLAAYNLIPGLPFDAGVATYSIV